MKKKITVVLVSALIIGLISGAANAKLVACVGDSITYGWGIPNRNDNSYPAQLVSMLQQFDNEWETQNFGHSGATLLSNTNLPYVSQNAYNRALASEPDVVVIQLGSNDTARATILQIEQNFIPDYLALIDAFAQLPSQPRIFVCNPPPIFGGGYGSNATLRDLIIPLIEQLPTYRAVEVIDLYTPLEESGHLFPDNLHPNTKGAKVMAEVVASVILGFRFLPDFNGDGKIDIEDLIILIEHWGQSEPTLDIVPPPLGDSMVDRADLEVLMAYWGQEINDPTLTSHWALDETEGMVVTDSLGNNDGYALGDPVWQPEGGVVGGAIALDGVDDHVSTGPALNPAYGPFSVLAWVKGGAPGQVILSQEGGVNWLMVDAINGSLRTDLRTPATTGRGASPPGPPLISTTVVTNGDWRRISFVADGVDRILYVDDIEVARDAAESLESADGGLYIGAGSSLEPGTFFSGLIDDVRIYNRAVKP
ncbi:MAG: GDSL-type esterase/lipase family protein [Planctomycetota bacterium]|jgi:lysophospholipase L1-like esterase